MGYIIVGALFVLAVYLLKLFFRISRSEMDLGRLSTRMSSLQDSLQSIQDEVNSTLKILKEDLGEMPGAEKGYEDINGDAAASIHRDKPEAYFLDVRSLPEYEERHVPKAKLIPLDELPRRFQEIPKNRKPVVILCEQGQRSAIACEMLAREGFEDIMKVEGGMQAWPGEVESTLDPPPDGLSGS